MRKEQFDLHARIEDEHWWFVGRRHVLKEIVDSIPSESGQAVVIDVGCGTGANLAALASHYSCTGIDRSEDAVRLAKQRFPAIKFLHGDGRELIARTQQGPKLLLLLDVLEHIEDDIGFFSAIMQSMRPGDHLLLTVPANMSLWSLQDVNHGHFRRYERDTLERLWRNHRVQVLLLSNFNFFLFPVISAIRAYNRWRKRTWGDAGTDLKLPSPWLNRILTAIFSSEGPILRFMLKRGKTSGFPKGVSLIALLRKGQE